MRLWKKKEQSRPCRAQETSLQRRDEAGAALSVTGLCLSYGKESVLKDISFSLKAGEFISLFGPSGCGKSSILKSIAGLLPIDSGAIEIGGSDVTELLPERRGTVIVFQDLRLFPHMTAAQNLCFPMQLRGVPRAEQNERAEALLKEVQLPGLGSRRVSELSGGQQQRVALARALAASPRILLLDEPFSGLDEALRREMGQLVRRIHKERGLSTILVTHDREEAMQLSDRIALIKEGHLLQYDTPRLLYQKPQSREAAVYLGEASFIRGVVRDGVFSCPLFSLRTAHGDGVCEAVVRPGAAEVSVRAEARKADNTQEAEKKTSAREYTGNEYTGDGGKEADAAYRENKTARKEANAACEKTGAECEDGSERGVLCTVREAVFLGECVLLKLDTPAGALCVRTAPRTDRDWRGDMADETLFAEAGRRDTVRTGADASYARTAGGFYAGQEVWVRIHEAHCI